MERRGAKSLLTKFWVGPDSYRLMADKPSNTCLYIKD